MLGVQVVDVSDYSRIRGKILYSSFLSIKKGKNHFAKVNPIALPKYSFFFACSRL